MRQIGKLFVAQLKMTFREKQVWFWSIFYPVLLMVVFLTIFGGFGNDDSSFEAKIAVVEGGDPAIPGMAEQLSQIELFTWKDEKIVSEEQAREWVEDQEIDAAVVVPQGTDSTVTVWVNAEKSNSVVSQTVSGIVGQLITQHEFAQANVQPQFRMSMETISSGNANLKYSDFLLTGMIGLTIAQAGLFGLVSMVEMRRNGLLKRLRMTPMNMRAFGIGGVLVRFVMGIIQVALLTAIGLLLYDATLDFSIVSFLIVFIVGIMSFGAIGYLIAALSKSMDAYFGIANVASFVMMFLSGVFFEYAMLPDYVKPLAHVLPLTYFVEGVRDSMVYGLSVTDASLWTDVGILALWGAVCFAIAAKLYKTNADVVR